MTLQRETIRRIREHSGLSEEKQEALIKVLKAHPKNALQLVRWIQAVEALTGKGFAGLLGFQKSEMIRRLGEGLGGGQTRQAWLRQVLGIYLCEGPDECGEEVFGPLAALLATKMQEENKLELKADMVELLLHLPIDLSHQIEPEGLRAGLHHQDDVVRCRTLTALHKLFGAKGLAVALKELELLQSPPSRFFQGTLRHLVRQCPRMLWDRDYRQLLQGKFEDFHRLQQPDTSDAESLGQRHSGLRLGLRIAAIFETGKADSVRARRKSPCRKRLPYPGALRWERFELIGGAWL